MKKHSAVSIVLGFFVCVLGLGAWVYLQQGRFIQMYISSGIGDCQKIPILCRQPTEELQLPSIARRNEDFIPQRFDRVSLSVPKGFAVVQETVQRPYYKKHKDKERGNTIYVLRQGPGYFPALFPQLVKEQVTTNYEFIRRIMHAQLGLVQDLTDAFFLIMKGIFIPDIGDQRQARMVSFTQLDKKGFLTYSQGQKQQFFDCNCVDAQDNFYKLYIKDASGKLALEDVLAVIATLRP
jgi:hypothetical protein